MLKYSFEFMIVEYGIRKGYETRHSVFVIKSFVDTYDGFKLFGKILMPAYNCFAPVYDNSFRHVFEVFDFLKVKNTSVRSDRMLSAAVDFIYGNQSGCRAMFANENNHIFRFVKCLFHLFGLIPFEPLLVVAIEIID